MTYYYRFAGITLQVELPEPIGEQGKLAPFLTEEREPDHVFSFEMVEELSPPEGYCMGEDHACRVYQREEGRIHYLGAVEKSWQGAYMRVCHQGKIHQAEVKRKEAHGGIGVYMVLNAIWPEGLLTEVEGVILHGALISRNGTGIVFTAPSGTGKSTQAELWKSLRGAEIINGDRAGIRVTRQGVLGEGIPFSGSSEHCENRSAVLNAIVYLYQGTENTIERLSGVDAFRKIWEGVSVNVWDREHVRRVSDAVIQIIEQVPIYALRCTPDERAVCLLEQTLGK